MATGRKDARPSKARPSKSQPNGNTRSPATTPKKKQNPPRSPPKKPPKPRPISDNSISSTSSTAPLSSGALARLDALNEKAAAVSEKERRVHEEGRRKESKAHDLRQKEKVVTGRVVKERLAGKNAKRKEGRSREKRRVVSGALMEEGQARRSGYVNARREGRGPTRRFWLILAVVVVLLAILIPVGVVLSKKKSGSGNAGGGGGGSSDPPANAELKGANQNDIPVAAKGTVLDPFTWYDTKDFNVTYTNVTFGGLPIMGLNSTWDDTARANQNTPPLNKNWTYGPSAPIRGVNLGGWLSLEPFITPSLFNTYSSSENVVDEYTLCEKLGAQQAAQTLEKHYDTFVTEQTFADIQAAGLDHVRIPYSYWAITTYPGDPYVPKISWRYLLRGIEYARKYGLRVNLDLHAVPGSQNGWNHSGRQGVIGWLNGTDGTLNGQRTLDIHTQIATFFAQPRYDNVITFYGLVNEPKMISLDVPTVITWTTNAIDVVRKNGITQTIVIGDGFLGLPKWHGLLPGASGVVLDAHQYVIFNQGQIQFTHQNKIDFACSGWSSQTEQSMNLSTGFGPTMCGEWSQADTDCAPLLNNVNVGSRWTGTYNTGDPSTQVLSPSCPPNSGTCQCAGANADPSKYSATYKNWLMMNAEAQMTSFELGWGWFYWTWVTEAAVQWSWKLGLEAGILPKLAYQRSFNCTSNVGSFSGLPENY